MNDTAAGGSPAPTQRGTHANSNPNLPSPDAKGPRRLLIVRYVPTEEYLNEVREAAIQFLNEAESMFEFMSTETA